MFHEALLTTEQPGWSIARGVPLRALLGAAAAGACIGWTIASLPAASAGLYQRVTNLEVTPNPNGWFYSETPGGVSDGAVQRKSWAAAGYPICGEGRAQSPIDIDTRHGNGPNARAIIERAKPNPSPCPSLNPNLSSRRSRACWTTASTRAFPPSGSPPTRATTSSSPCRRTRRQWQLAMALGCAASALGSRRRTGTRRPRTPSMGGTQSSRVTSCTSSRAARCA